VTKKSRLDEIVVLSYYGKCCCGAIIPYGQRTCPGHGRIRGPYLKTCYNCMGQTYLYNGKYPQWRRDNKDKVICKKCCDKLWRVSNIT
jgi:hypothetical protein